MRRVVLARELFSSEAAMLQTNNPRLANLYGSACSIYHLTLIGSVLVPLRVSDGRFWLGALLLETKLFRISLYLFFV